MWLVAAGGTLFYAFPLLYASSFSGFYLALNIVLWLLIFRALGIELRLHLSNPVWRAFFDGAFSLASLLLIVFFGAALGNVMRGVPLGADHYFFVPLWTDFRPGAEPGILDWYTVLCAVVTLAALSMHGALYLILKTSGALNERMRRIVRWLWPALIALSATALAATMFVRPQLLDNYRAGPEAGSFRCWSPRGSAASHISRAHGRSATRSCLLPVHRRDAGRRRVRALSRAAALVGRRRQQPHDPQCLRRRGVALRGDRLVVDRNAGGCRLLRRRLSHVPGQGHARRPYVRDAQTQRRNVQN